MIAICTPSRDLVNASFTYDLVQLIKYSPDSNFLVSHGTYLQNLRSTLVKQVLGVSTYTHILFIDSDMRFPKDTIERLLKHDVDFVGANCRQRSGKETTARSDGKFVHSQNRLGLSEVSSLGFGVTLIKADVFKTVPQPWFGMPYDGTTYVGEDIFFCKQLEKAEVKMYVDHDLSKEVKHTGSVELEVL